MNELKVFSGNSNPKLAQSICSYLKLPLSSSTARTFLDGEVEVKLGENVRVNSMGLKASSPKAGLYVWARVPSGYTSMEFANDLLEQVGVVVTPGVGYGKRGEGYVRLSLTIADASLVRGLSRLAEWHDRKGGPAKKVHLT